MPSEFVSDSKSNGSQETSDAWRLAQDEIDKAGARKAEIQGNNLSSRKSLYEVLEANKGIYWAFGEERLPVSLALPPFISKSYSFFFSYHRTDNLGSQPATHP